MPAQTVFYHQKCPVCGRMLQIRVNLLGQSVYCQHCGGGFVAADDSAASPSAAERAAELLERAAEVLAQSTDGR